jgi:hypothetical protein
MEWDGEMNAMSRKAVGAINRDRQSTASSDTSPLVTDIEEPDKALQMIRDLSVAHLPSVINNAKPRVKRSKTVQSIQELFT